jgi:hypothetical protein
VKKEREEKLLRIGDAGRIIRQAQREIAESAAFERRRQEVDGPAADAPRLDVPLLAVEDSSGVWAFTTTTAVFPGCPELKVRERSEPIAIAEMRQTIKDAMIDSRYASPEQARSLCARASVYVAGRVPFARIVSK